MAHEFVERLSDTDHLISIVIDGVVTTLVLPSVGLFETKKPLQRHEKSIPPTKGAEAVQHNKN